LRIDAHHSCTDRYPLAHLASILDRNRFEGSVLVQDCGEALPDFVKAIVLPRITDHPKQRGVILESHSGLDVQEIEQRGLSLDWVGGLAHVAEIAGRHPGLRIAIVHLGLPPFEGWAEALAQAAAFPNVYCKVSGLLRIQGSPREYVQHALRLFGPGRLMFGSDWPEALPEHAWKASLAAFTQAIGAQTIATREELLGGTAARFYGIGEHHV